MSDLRILLPALILGAAALTGCVTTPDKGGSVVPDSYVQTNSYPQWVTSPPKAGGRVYGVGSMEVYGNPDQALKRASELARADLISQLRVTVASDTSSVVDEYSLNGETSLQKSLRQAVSSRTPEVTLDELVIADTYVDNNYAYALAELDRSATAARLAADMASVEADISGMESQPLTGSTPLQRLQQQLPALDLFAQYDKLADQYALVSESHRRPQLDDNLRRYRTGIMQDIRELKVQLVLLDKDARTLSPGLIQALTEQGFRISSTPSGVPDLIFEVAASLDEQKQDGNYYVFANASIRLKDGAGQLLSAFSGKGRGVSGLPKAAEDKAAAKLADIIAEELSASLAQRLQ